MLAMTYVIRPLLHTNHHHPYHPLSHIHHTRHPRAQRNLGSISPYFHVSQVPAATTRGSVSALMDPAHVANEQQCARLSHRGAQPTNTDKRRTRAKGEGDHSHQLSCPQLGQYRQEGQKHAPRACPGTSEQAIRQSRAYVSLLLQGGRAGRRRGHSSSGCSGCPQHPRHRQKRQKHAPQGRPGTSGSRPAHCGALIPAKHRRPGHSWGMSEQRTSTNAPRPPRSGVTSRSRGAFAPPR